MNAKKTVVFVKPLEIIRFMGFLALTHHVVIDSEFSSIVIFIFGISSAVHLIGKFVYMEVYFRKI